MISRLSRLLADDRVETITISLNMVQFNLSIAEKELNAMGNDSAPFISLAVRVWDAFYVLEQEE